MDQSAIPQDFHAALLSLRAASERSDMVFTEVPPPRNLSPFAAAMHIRTAQVDQFDEPFSYGRVVVLYDPEGQPGWNGDFRFIAQLRSYVDPEMGTDPLLGEALWGWTDECLYQSGAAYHDLAGTVTRELSEAFGGLELKASNISAEIRASWTPADSNLDPHLNAWCDLMMRACGTGESRFLDSL